MKSNKRSSLHCEHRTCWRPESTEKPTTDQERYVQGIGNRETRRHCCWKRTWSDLHSILHLGTVAQSFLDFRSRQQSTWWESFTDDALVPYTAHVRQYIRGEEEKIGNRLTSLPMKHGLINDQYFFSITYLVVTLRGTRQAIHSLSAVCDLW